jgi:hypothetical protein
MKNNPLKVNRVKSKYLMLNRWESKLRHEVHPLIYTYRMYLKRWVVPFMRKDDLQVVSLWVALGRGVEVGREVRNGC